MRKQQLSHGASAEVPYIVVKGMTDLWTLRLPGCAPSPERNSARKHA
jgi:hypothetical protein